MFTVSFDLLIAGAGRSVERWPLEAWPSWMVRTLVRVRDRAIARRVDRFAERVSQQVLTLSGLAQHVRSVEDGEELIDADGAALDALEQLRGKCAQGRVRTLGMARDLEGERVQTQCHPALLRLAAVLHELGMAATDLEWAILEHDAQRAPRQPGYVAESAEEVATLLDRIAAGG